MAARLGVRGLRGDPVPGLRRRRLGGRLLQRDPAPARRAQGAAQGPDRPLGAQVPAFRHARPRDRLPPGVPALVGPLAEGHRHRDHGRADATGSGCRRACRPAAHYDDAAGPLGGRAVLAVAQHPARRPTRSEPGPLGEGWPGETAPTSPVRTPQFLGTAAGSWCRYGAQRRRPLGPAGRRRHGRMLRHRAALRAPRNPGRTGVLTLELSSDRPNAFFARACATSRPTARLARVTYGLLNLTHRESHEHPEPLEPAGATGAAAAERHRARVPARPPHPPRALDHLLADRLALARGGHGHRAHRRQPAQPAGPSAA